VFYTYNNGGATSCVRWPGRRGGRDNNNCRLGGHVSPPFRGAGTAGPEARPRAPADMVESADDGEVQPGCAEGTEECAKEVERMFRSSSGGDATEVDAGVGRPSEIAEEIRDRLFGAGVVAREEDRRGRGEASRVAHDARTHGVERLDDADVGERPLEFLTEAAVGIDEREAFTVRHDGVAVTA
jgi:hypothetical protein